MKNDKSFFQFQFLFILILLSAVFFVIERVIGRYVATGRKQPVIRKGWWTDVIYWFTTALLVKPVVRVATIYIPFIFLLAAKVTTKEQLTAGQYHGFGPLSLQPLWLQAIEIYALVDLSGYWTHRLFHSGKWWPFHAVHHSSEDLDWLGALRVHPFNDLVNKFAQAAPILFFGLNPLITATTIPFLTFYAIFLHANVNWDFGPLRSIIATPVFHRWHHSRDREAWDKNFAGLFPFWDILFGTYYMPKNRYPENFGINEPMPAGYLAQLWEPLAWLRRRAKKVDPS